MSLLALVVLSPGDAVLLVSRDAQVAWPLACSQDKLCCRVKGLFSSFICCLSVNANKLKQVLQGNTATLFHFDCFVQQNILKLVPFELGVASDHKSEKISFGVATYKVSEDFVLCQL